LLNVLNKFHTRVNNARKAKKMKKIKAQEKAKEGGLNAADKARMTRMKTNITGFCQILGIDDEWSNSDDFEALKAAHADLNKRSKRTGHLRTLGAKWATVFDSEIVFPDESDFPKTGKDIETFYHDLKNKFNEKKAENSEDVKWERTYEKRAQKFFSKAPDEDAKPAVQAFHKDMGGADVLLSDFKLWDFERSGKTFGLSRREEFSRLRLDTVSIKRENLKKLLGKYNGSDVEKHEDLGVVRTLYGKIVKFDDGFVPSFPAPKKKGKKRKKSEEEEEEAEAIEVRF
jgi:muconolactone delta-isomerase